MIKAKLLDIAVSTEAGEDSEISTWELTYPRFIHAELMTHRLFSRNAASSRAIPITKMIADVIKTPAMPVFWGRNRKGMQATDQHTGWSLALCKRAWLFFRWFAVIGAWVLYKMQLHKQLANRLLEPWAHMTIIMTTGRHGFMNMMALRHHPDAQPEFQTLAALMLPLYVQARLDGKVKLLDPGMYYIPMVSPEEHAKAAAEGQLERLVSIACGRIAAVSYMRHTEKSDYEAIAINNRLESTSPKHASPFEHVAIVDTDGNATDRCGNLPPGWIQHRHRLGGESVKSLSLHELMAKMEAAPPWLKRLRFVARTGLDSHGCESMELP